MPHDGQDLPQDAAILLPDLLSLTGAAVAPVEQVFEAAREALRATVSRDGKVSAGLIEAIDTLRRRPEFDVTVLYLDCQTEVLLRRFSETRRRHPLALSLIHI